MYIFHISCKQNNSANINAKLQKDEVRSCNLRVNSLHEQRYLTSVVDNEFRLLRVRQAVHEYCKLERAVLFGYEA